MSTQTNSTENGHQTLSEKARRLLAAHDREVSEYRRIAETALRRYKAQLVN